MKRQSSMLTKILVNDREAALKVLRQTAFDKSESIYIGPNAGEILMVNFAGTAVELLQIVESEAMKAREAALRENMKSDWSRQLLSYVATAKESSVSFEQAAYLQLRYIEVPIRVHAEYLDWRERTIFAHVRKQNEIDFFHAYHTVVSTQPGVMFLSGFSCPEDHYQQLFDNPHYREIVKEAGSRYIVDGENGLYTCIYKKV